MISKYPCHSKPGEFLRETSDFRGEANKKKWAYLIVTSWKSKADSRHRREEEVSPGGMTGQGEGIQATFLHANVGDPQSSTGPWHDSASASVPSCDLRACASGLGSNEEDHRLSLNFSFHFCWMQNCPPPWVSNCIDHRCLLIYFAIVYI